MPVNYEKTKAWYNAMGVENLCDCAYCVNFRREVRKGYPKVTEYLATLGIDVEKPLEASPLEVEADGTVAYCVCQYVVFGSCPPEFSQKIDEVELACAASYPATGIEEENFVLDVFSLRLPWSVAP